MKNTATKTYNEYTAEETFSTKENGVIFWASTMGAGYTGNNKQSVSALGFKEVLNWMRREGVSNEVRNALMTQFVEWNNSFANTKKMILKYNLAY